MKSSWPNASKMVSRRAQTSTNHQKYITWRVPNFAHRLRIIWNWSNVFCIVSPALVLVTPFIVELLQTIQKILRIIQTGLINFVSRIESFGLYFHSLVTGYEWYEMHSIWSSHLIFENTYIITNDSNDNLNYFHRFWIIRNIILKIHNWLHHTYCCFGLHGYEWFNSGCEVRSESH